MKETVQRGLQEDTRRDLRGRAEYDTFVFDKRQYVE
jgi:hypothetical protein